MSIKVLIVEDNLMAANIAKGLIAAQMHAKIELADSGESALNAVKSHPFQLILMDIGLGKGIDGAITTREIRKIETQYHRPHCPIYALSAHVTEKDEAYYRSMGIDGTLIKPLSSSKLSRMVAEHPEILKEPKPLNKKKLDIDAIADTLFNGDTKLAQALADDFIKQLSLTINEIENLYRAKQYHDVVDEIQKLLGSCTYTQADDLIDAANKIINRHKEYQGFSEQYYQGFMRACRQYLA